ncbi:MAG: type II toxin-antitoxin system VapC family toxin [Alphaproteobacteria bacterium]|uniref:Type II toxin-antitoxin system VapC family toxin n=1 Tax=Candidatus Nitrobium versatile TaxID=2884831 RepID=A0A953JD89_9BACT|nr:type II toxin-antitoxin system VapC family toxin [Candidatus Nitrobium versatile]
MYLFDTDALSQILKKNPSVPFIRKIASLTPEVQFTTTITVGELVYGAYKSSRPEFFIGRLEELVWPNIHILSFDESAAKIYGKLRAEMERKGTPLAEPDLRIVSIALCHGLTVITGNMRHFSKVPELAVENWMHES